MNDTMLVLARDDESGTPILYVDLHGQDIDIWGTGGILRLTLDEWLAVNMWLAERGTLERVDVEPQPAPEVYEGTYNVITEDPNRVLRIWDRLMAYLNDTLPLHDSIEREEMGLFNSFVAIWARRQLEPQREAIRHKATKPRFSRRWAVDKAIEMASHLTDFRAVSLVDPIEIKAMQDCARVLSDWRAEWEKESEEPEQLREAEQQLQPSVPDEILATLSEVLEVAKVAAYGKYNTDRLPSYTLTPEEWAKFGPEWVCAAANWQGNRWIYTGEPTTNLFSEWSPGGIGMYVDTIDLGDTDWRTTLTWRPGHGPGEEA